MPAQEVTIALTRFQKVSEALGTLGTVASIAAAVPGMISLFKNQKSDTDRMLDALEGMTRRLEEKLEEGNVIAADAIRTELWTPTRERLHENKMKIVGRANQLKTYKEATHEVQVGSDWISIAKWCEPDFGVLAELNYVLGDTGRVLSTAILGKVSAIDEWDLLVASGAVKRVLGIDGETRFSLMYEWYQSICVMVQTAAYVHNYALMLYQKPTTPATPGHEAADFDKTLDDLGGRRVANLDSMLDELGHMSFVDENGQVQKAKGVWAAFEKKFEELLKVPMNDDHNRLAALSSFNDSDNKSKSHFSNDHRFFSGGFRMRGSSNCYISGLEIGYLKDDVRRGWKVMATVAKIGDDGTVSVWREAVDGPISESGFGAYWEVNEHDYGGILPHERLGAGTVEPPSITLTGNQGLVVTGWGVQHHHGAYVIALEYGLMTIDPNGKLSVTGIGSEENGPLRAPKKLTETFKLTDDVDELCRGRAGTKSLFPLTDASFGRANNYDVHIRVRGGWRAFKADVYQPTYLKRFSPGKWLAQPAGSNASMSGTWDLTFDDNAKAILVLNHAGGSITGDFDSSDPSDPEVVSFACAASQSRFQTRLGQRWATISGELGTLIVGDVPAEKLRGELAWMPALPGTPGPPMKIPPPRRFYGIRRGA